MMQKIFASRLYPIVPQALVLGIFVYILFALLWGTENAHDNFGSVMVWILWWPVIPLTFIFLGRIWCALCPWGALSDWLQSHFSLDLKVPKPIKKYGIWIIFGGFILITWYELAFGLTTSTKATVTVLLVVAAAALITSLLLERRAWCRYLCPLGGIFGNYAQTAAVEFRGTKEICATCTRADCYKGSDTVAGCPLFEFPKQMDSNRLCNLCGNCVKTCRNDSPKLKFRMPGKELWEKKEGKLDEAVLASVLVGAILIAGFGMLEFWQAAVENIIQSTGISKAVIVTAAYATFGLVALLLTLGASAISARSTGEKTWKNFARYGYALIPLNLATHSAHNMFHLLGEGGSIGTVIKDMVASKAAHAAETVTSHASNAVAATGGHADVSAALASPGAIKWIQFGLMAAGIAASILVAWKISGRDEKKWGAFLPHLALIGVFGFASFMLFVLPMTLRH